MFGPEDRPRFDDVFGNLNDLDARPGGETVGFVVKVWPDLHAVDVELPAYGHMLLQRVKVNTNWHGGPRTGIHMLPPVEAKVRVTFEQNKSAFPSGKGARVVGLDYTSDEPPPSNPAQKGKTEYWALQTGIRSGKTVSPGTFEMRDNQGNIAKKVMGKEDASGMGAGDQRDRGLSLTQEEASALKASNAIAGAREKVADLPTTLGSVRDLQALATGFKSIARDMSLSSMASFNAAGSYAERAVGQTEAASIGTQASRIAAGDELSDEIVEEV